MTESQGAWSTGCHECFSDISSCCLTTWCPCVAFGRIAEIVDKGSSSCFAIGALYLLLHCTRCGWIFNFFYRHKMREQYNLEGSNCGDFCMSCFCEYCAICQEYRELKNRGFDMSIGWDENVSRRTPGVAMAPKVEEGMKR
ncbi:protein PLANT CADMIUM RESISTANCE 2-like [Pistacia vera]|uniref:protein PLANT CADMIUM RESISTANCE 2-like n=1 Tax=Pistacia vera TaxID=55513 RepID=UPI001262FD85|nr:protein PLANT CADMIUM RESISTANCE 2-like [Pistacia vera]